MILKPDNILFKDNFILKFTDFEMANDLSDLEKGMSHNKLVKTTVYHDPETIE